MAVPMMAGGGATDVGILQAALLATVHIGGSLH